MACDLQSKLILVSLCLFFPLTSLSKEIGHDYKNWISWNVQKYKREAAVQHSKSMRAATRGQRDIDLKLAKAEEAKVSYIVSQDGNGDFKSIMEAIETIPEHNTGRVTLVIRPGVYREKIVIPKTKSFITFLGSADNPPVLTGNDTAATIGKDGAPLRTFHSATVAVNSHFFVAAYIKFENTAPHPSDGREGTQAVALRISGDKAAFYNCSFHGSQDTLYDHKGLHYFSNCFIQGSVDFIFGYGRSLYQNCVLNSITEKVAWFTAQKGNEATMESGFSFINCTITGSGLMYLGRAWGDHSRVVYSYTYMDQVVIPDGWDSWRTQHPEESGIYYGEYQCKGPGANFTSRVNWAHQLTAEEAQPFLGTHFIHGDTWISGAPTKFHL